MEVIETQLEVHHVAEAVGLSLEGFDLVVDPLDYAVGNQTPAPLTIVVPFL
jgi:hypothetical protein